MRRYACKSVEELAKMLENSHYYLMSDEGLNHGYLYQKQVEMNNKLKEELRECKAKMST